MNLMPQGIIYHTTFGSNGKAVGIGTGNQYKTITFNYDYYCLKQYTPLLFIYRVLFIFRAKEEVKKQQELERNQELERAESERQLEEAKKEVSPTFDTSHPTYVAALLLVNYYFFMDFKACGSICDSLSN